MKTASVLAAAILTVVVGQSALSQQGLAHASKRIKSTPPARRVAQEQIPPVAAFLNQPVEEVDWDDVSFSTVVEWLREQNNGINVIIVWRALEIGNVDADTAISLHMRDTTVGNVLEEVLEQLSPLSGEIRYQGVGDTLKISTRTHFNQKLYVRVYDVNDLILPIPDFLAPPLGVLTSAPIGLDGAVGGERGEGGSVEERMEKFVEMIRDAAGPDRWRDNGGECTIHAHKTNIIVRAPIEVHEIIGGPFVLPN